MAGEGAAHARRCVTRGNTLGECAYLAVSRRGFHSTGPTGASWNHDWSRRARSLDGWGVIGGVTYICGVTARTRSISLAEAISGAASSSRRSRDARCRGSEKEMDAIGQPGTLMATPTQRTPG